jgi:protein-S-isoprenylcysteine O-methyltransferase Ste14
MKILRFRRWALLLIFVIGFWAPFERLHGAHPETTWLFLSGLLARHGILPIAYASIAVMGAAILLALLSALLRTWASSYPDSGVAGERNLQGEQIVADGPYRHLRNPLYAGLWLHTLALALLMPPGGALFAVIAVGILAVALAHAEEHAQVAESGEDYAGYMRVVPRFLPAITPRVPSSGERAQWGSGFLREIYMWGAVMTYAAFASRYNVTVIEQGILISLGISIVMQGFLRPVRVLASR